MLGRTIGKYRVVEKIGRGGMGTVYKAIDETLDREVAIKALNPDLGESEVVRRFRAEARTLARLNHPGIATIYELFRADDDLLMVMEFVRGETFDRIIDRTGPLAPARAAGLAAQVLDALGHAHRVGIVHRDLKPANLMLTQYGAVKIMDFGIARVLGSEHLTSDGLMMGTPAYMAPEQVLGTEVDARADLYAVGVVLYRLLTGNLPFQADSAIAMAHKQVKDPPTPLHQFRAELPGWCDVVLNRALKKSPPDRYQTAEEFRESLVSVGASPVAAVASADSLEPTYSADEIPVVKAGAEMAPIRSTTPAPLSRETVAPPSSVAVEPAPSQAGAPAQPQRAAIDGSTTVVLQRQHLAFAAGLFALLVVLLGALAAFVVPRPGATTPAVPGSSAETAAATSSPPTPAPKPTQEQPAPAGAGATPSATVAAAPATPASATPTRTPPPGSSANVRDTTKAIAPATRAAPAPAVAPRGETAEPAPTPPAPPVPAARDASLPPLTFADVKVVVADAGRLRERNAILTFAAGTLTVAERNGQVVHTVLYEGILSVSYSRSRQPLWQSPGGPAPVLKVGGGAFGIFRSDPHWYSIRTKNVFLVLRVEPQHARTLPAAFSNRAGASVQVVRPRP